MTRITFIDATTLDVLESLAQIKDRSTRGPLIEVTLSTRENQLVGVSNIVTVNTITEERS